MTYGWQATPKVVHRSREAAEVDPHPQTSLGFAELRLGKPHVVRLEARPPNVEGSGEITLRDLVRQALRMRPDRLVIGEVRGAEVVDLGDSPLRVQAVTSPGSGLIVDKFV